METVELGISFAQFLNNDSIVLLEGELGAGKTEFIKGICQYFSVEDVVTSPTFALINQYIGLKDNKEFSIFHLDLYRINNSAELDEIGFVECLNDNTAIKLIEWPQNAGNRIVTYNYKISIEIDKNNPNIRYIEILDNN